jgi:hypothetical protein
MQAGCRTVQAARPARALGLVHGGVGVAQHVVGIGVAEGAEGDADAGVPVTSVPATMKRLAQRGPSAARPAPRRRARVRCGRPGSRTRRRPAAPRTSCGRSFSWMRRATCTSNSSPAVWPRLSLTSLKRSKSRNITAKGTAGRRAAARHRARPGIPGSGAGWAARSGVVEGHVVQPGLGAAARADVLRLQDEAGRVAVGFGEEAAVQRGPDACCRRGGGSATRARSPGTRAASSGPAGLAARRGRRRAMCAGIDVPCSSASQLVRPAAGPAPGWPAGCGRRSPAAPCRWTRA